MIDLFLSVVFQGGVVEKCMVNLTGHFKKCNRIFTCHDFLTHAKAKIFYPVENLIQNTRNITMNQPF